MVPQLADVILGLVDRQLARSNCVKGSWITRALEVGAVGAGALTTGVGNCEVVKKSSMS